MPLPDSAPLSLQVSSNAVQSKPKRAMIVRMSAETLEALEAFPSHPPMSFDFGDNPGIYIGDTFFPMRPQKESSPHELYLRAASSAKPMAPLKLYANVIGKFMVERQLGNRVTDKVRQQTMVAKQQHMERQAILLDRPPISVKNGKRKVPGSGTVVKKTSASDHLRPAEPSTALTRKVSPLPQNPPSSKANADVRRRLVHCLAINPRLAEDAVKMVGGANISASARKDLLALLEDVAEQQAAAKKGDKSPRPWLLKPQTWTEVRPFEWPKLTEAERITMARQARMAFKALKIPESDPAWENVRYRATASALPISVPTPPPMTASNSSRSSTSTQAETKRSAIITKDVKMKSKQDLPRAKGEIQMKDESTRTTISRVNAIKREDPERQMTPSDSSIAAKMVASRRLPGSGYQAKKSPLPAGVAERSGTPVDPRPVSKPSLPASLPTKPTGGSHARKTIPTMPPKSVKKEDESDRERDRQYERQREREHEKREREKEKQQREDLERDRERERAETEKREKARQKEREAMEREKRQREKEREREEMEREKRLRKKEREREELEQEKRQRKKEREQEEMEQEKRRREKERIPKETAAGGSVPIFKRRTTVAPDSQETPDDASLKPPLQKRRKLDDGTSVASSSSQTRDAGSKKPTHDPSPVPRLKMKKDPSPQTSERRAMTSASGSAHRSERAPKANGNAKSRRRSPIYTSSSEDEGEIPQPRKRKTSPPPTSDRSNSSDQLPSEKAPRHHRTPRSAYPPATDHAALRAMYQSQYSNYLWSFTKVVAQKRKIEAMLNGDSEGEVDVMDPDDLVKLSTEHKSLKTDLENIHDLYTKGTMRAAAAVSGGGGSTPD